MSLLKFIAEYDREQQDYISYLEEKVKALEEEKRKAIDLAFKGAQESSGNMLKLILSGALKKPERCEQCTHTASGQTCIACEQKVA